MIILYIVLGIYLAITLALTFLTVCCALAIASRKNPDMSASGYIVGAIITFFPCLFFCLIPFYRWKYLLNMAALTKIEDS